MSKSEILKKMNIFSFILLKYDLDVPLDAIKNKQQPKNRKSLRVGPMSNLTLCDITKAKPLLFFF